MLAADASSMLRALPGEAKVPIAEGTADGGGRSLAGGPWPAVRRGEWASADTAGLQEAADPSARMAADALSSSWARSCPFSAFRISISACAGKERNM